MGNSSERLKWYLSDANQCSNKQTTYMNIIKEIPEQLLSTCKIDFSSLLTTAFAIKCSKDFLNLISMRSH